MSYQQTLPFKTVKQGNNEIEEIKNDGQSKVKQNLPWVEKYRPNKIAEVSYQTEVTESFRGILKTGNLPHLLLYGPPGTGKTSSILALAKQLFGPDYFKQRVLELNASDERGINVVREKIKKFAQQIASKSQNIDYQCPFYKIIILDEADSMTQEAQSALRRIIEDTSANTRFCIICNYITKIIEPIRSRCVKFRFKPILIEDQIKKLKEIGKAENLLIQPGAFEKLVKNSNGDLRKSVNLLQIASQIYSDNISEEVVDQISGHIPQLEIQNIIDTLLDKKTTINLIKDMNTQILLCGYSPQQIVIQLADFVVKSEAPILTDNKKAQILQKIAYCDKCLNEGAENEIQLLNLFTSSYNIIKQL